MSRIADQQYKLAMRRRFLDVRDEVRVADMLDRSSANNRRYREMRLLRALARLLKISNIEDEP